MGFGDYIVWTAIIRDLYKYVNNGSMENKLNNIKKLKFNNKHFIQEIKQEDDSLDFKFFVYIQNAKCPLNKHQESKEIFKNNPYIINSPKKYGNVIMLVINSSDYSDYIPPVHNFFDDQHVVERYAKIFGLTNYSLEGDLHFKESEKSKIESYLPKEDFILIQPSAKYGSRFYPFEKFQKIVNALKDKIKFVQVSPSKFANKELKFLDNVKVIKDVFSYKETIYFSKFAKLCLVNHGGMSIGISCFKTPSVVIYPGLYKPKMWCYDSEIIIKTCDETHQSCGNFLYGCKICNQFYEKHDENIIIDKINEYLEK